MEKLLSSHLTGVHPNSSEESLKFCKDVPQRTWMFGRIIPSLPLFDVFSYVNYDPRVGFSQKLRLDGLP